MSDFLPLALSLLSLAISVASAVFSVRFAPGPALAQRLTTQESDLTELSDRVHHWMRRDSVRRIRDKPAEAQVDVELPGTSPKAALFSRARDVFRRTQ